MKTKTLTLLLSALLFGCSSQPSTDADDRFQNMTGGQSVGDATSFYWYTEELEYPYSAADYVDSGKHGWYFSDYRWRDGVVREIVRQGEQLQEKNGLVPFKIHLRFNQSGEAVYQQYRLDGKVLPMQPQHISMVQNSAESIKNTVKKQHSKGQRLIQGYWDGKGFKTCSGESYQNVEFNQILPDFVVNRLANLDSYAAFLGTTSPSKLVVQDLYMLEEDSVDCVNRPVLVPEE